MFWDVLLIYANECTTNIDRISYARIRVEMDVTCELPITVKYDWKPVYCAKCLQIGYACQTISEEAGSN